MPKSIVESLLDYAEELSQESTCACDLAEALLAQEERGYDPYNSDQFMAVRS